MTEQMYEMLKNTWENLKNFLGNVPWDKLNPLLQQVQDRAWLLAVTVFPALLLFMYFWPRIKLAYRRLARRRQQWRDQEKRLRNMGRRAKERHAADVIFNALEEEVYRGRMTYRFARELCQKIGTVAGLSDLCYHVAYRRPSSYVKARIKQRLISDNYDPVPLPDDEKPQGKMLKAFANGKASHT